MDPTFTSRCTHLLCESQVSSMYAQVRTTGHHDWKTVALLCVAREARAMGQCPVAHTGIDLNV